MAYCRLVLLCCAVFVVNGCVTQRERPDNTELRESIDTVIEGLRVTLPGSYNNYSQRRQDRTAPALRLQIAATDQPARYLIQQAPVSGSTEEAKQFIWQFTRNDRERLLLDFAPIVNNQLQRSCRVELLPQPGGISGQTVPETCPLPNASGRPIGLLKEFLLSNGRIRLGERLQDIQTESALMADQKLDFRREVNYTGWAGKKNSSTGQWVLAVPFTLHNQGGEHVLVDSADQTMGYRVELAQIEYRKDQPEVLRLAVIDAATGKQVAYSWAGTNAEQIGINLDWIQIGLTRTN